MARKDSKEANPEVDKIRALLKAHDEAMTSQDLKGVMACFTEKAAIMGTGPGEIWVGPDEIKVAYEHFFEGFDKGEQNFEYQFNIGGVTPDLGWLMASGNITGKKDGKARAAGWINRRGAIRGGGWINGGGGGGWVNRRVGGGGGWINRW